MLRWRLLNRTAQTATGELGMGAGDDKLMVVELVGGGRNARDFRDNAAAGDWETFAGISGALALNQSRGLSLLRRQLS